jgi:hypothetical protein
MAVVPVRLLLVATPVLLLSVTVAVGAAVAAAGYRDIYRPALRAESELRLGAQLLGHVSVDTDRDQLTRSAGHLLLAEQDFARATRASHTNPLLRAAVVIPRVRDQVEAVRGLAAIGVHLSRAGRAGVAGGIELLELRDGAPPGSSPSERVSQGLDITGPAVARAAAELNTARQERAALHPEHLWTPLRDAVQELDRELIQPDALLREYPIWDEALRSLIGWGGTKTYLVLNQDSAELRPAGGFIGSIGFLRVENGKMAPFEFQDVYTFERGDRIPGMPGYVTPPTPLTRITSIAGWKLRDSNWSPDFPSAAREAERLLELETGTRVDGVIAIDPPLIERLLGVTGPVAVPEVHQTFTAENFFLQSLLLSSLTIGADRKDFLKVFGLRLMDRLLGITPSQWSPLAQMLQESCLSHDLQVALHDPAVQSLIIQRFHCDGAMATPFGDYVMAVDANVGGGKDNYWLNRAFSAQVQLRPDGTVGHALAIRYRNAAPNRFPYAPYSPSR